MSKKVINQNTNYDSELLNSIDTNYIFNEKPINRLKITSDNLKKDNIDKKKEISKLYNEINSIEDCSLKKILKS